MTTAKKGQKQKLKNVQNVYVLGNLQKLEDKKSFSIS